MTKIEPKKSWKEGTEEILKGIKLGLSWAKPYWVVRIELWQMVEIGPKEYQKEDTQEILEGRYEGK